MKADIRVLGGLPVTVDYNILERRNFDGEDVSEVEWEIVAVGGRQCKKSPEWLNKRIAANPAEQERIDELLLNH